MLNELSVSELVEVLDQPQSTISRHLKVLGEAGLLVDRRHGSAVMYATHPSGPPAIDGEAEPERGRRNGENGVSKEAALRDRLLEWAGSGELDDGIHGRLQRVLKRRRTDSANFFETVGARWDQLRIEAAYPSHSTHYNEGKSLDGRMTAEHLNFISDSLDEL